MAQNNKVVLKTKEPCKNIQTLMYIFILLVSAFIFVFLQDLSNNAKAKRQLKKNE